MIKQSAALISLLIFVLLLTGCWGKTELNEIGIVTVTGVDLEPNGMIRITVMSVQPEGTSTTVPTRSSTWIGTATGLNLVDASKNLRAIAMKNLTWIHNTVIIIGQTAAQKAMDDVIDFFSRNREVRFSSYILVAQESAFEIMQVPADIQNDLPREIQGIIQNAPEWSKSYVATAKEFMVSQAENCGNYITGKLGATYESRTTFSAPRQEYEKLDLIDRKIPILNLEGCVIFKKGAMVGWLDPNEIRGYLWITGKLKKGTITAQMDDGELSFENNFNDTSIELKKNAEDITFLIKVDTRGILVEQTTSHDLSQEKIIVELEDRFASEIRNKLTSV